MATKHMLNDKDDFNEADELEDSEVPEMGEEEILTPKKPEEMEFDGADAELDKEPSKEEE